MRRQFARLIIVLLGVASLMLVALAALATNTEDVPVEPGVTFDLSWLAGIVGFFLPLLISLVKKAEWSTQLKRGVALAASIVAGVVTVGVQAGWDAGTPTEFVQLALNSVTQVWIVSNVAYNAFWSDTAIERGLESVGSKTASPDKRDEGYNAGDPPRLG